MTGNDPDIFDKLRLPPELDAYLRGTNPWWTDKPGRVLPSYQRWAFAALLRKLESRIAPVVVLRGARQVGKTTIQEQVIERLREDGVEPRRILRVQFDEIPSLKRLQEPILSIVRWYENRILGSTLNEAAHSGKPSLILFDEVQNLASWAPQIKALVDHHSVQVVVTGSSALRIEAGRDSLAGRITTLELGPLLLREIAGLTLGDAPPPLLPQNGLEPLLDQATWRRLELHGREYAELRDTAFTAFSERGGYPFVHANPDASWPEIADQLNETVIRRVIRHDLRMGDRGQKRDEHLLEEVFRLACRYAGQAPGQAHLLSELAGG